MFTAHITSLIIGVLIKQHLFNKQKLSSIFLTLGILLGLQSFTSFLLFITNNLNAVTLLIADCMWIGLLLILKRYHIAIVKHTNITLSGQHKWNKYPILISIVVFILTILSLTFFLYASKINPQGDWDAWAIWNMHAKFIVAGKTAWISSFNPILAWSHPDYPLLLPLTVARLWILSGNTNELSPIFVAALFTYGTALLLICSIWELRGYKSALICALIVFSEIGLFNLGLKQYADIPLSFYYLCSICVLFLPYNKNLQYFLSGAFAALAAWTKNEGILFSIMLSLTVVILEFKHKNYSNIKNYLTGLILFSLPMSIFKTMYAPKNDLFVEPLSVTINKITSIARLDTLFKYSLSHMVIFITANPSNWILPALIILKRGKVSKFLLVLIYTLLGYLLIYLITPHDMIWHINSSLPRLILHLYPSLLFLLFVSMKDL